MENAEFKEKYDGLNEEQRKIFVLKTFLDTDYEDMYKMLVLIKEIDNQAYKKYVREIFVGLFANVYKKDVEQVRKYFEDTEYCYNNILDKFNVLSRELKLENSLEISTLYTYLLWNGYFSKDKKFNYEIGNRALIEGRFSYDIMNGNGVCLNFSDMLKDILNNCGYNSSILLNKAVNSKEIKNGYIINIDRSIKKSKPLPKFLPLMLKPIIINKVGNHAFNLIQENGKLYIYDPTNLILLELKDKNKANLLVGTGKFKLSSYFSYIINDEESRKTLFMLNEATDFSSPYTRKDYIISSENNMEIFDANKQLLDDYHDDINGEIIKIADSVEYYKKNKKKILNRTK